MIAGLADAYTGLTILYPEIVVGRGRAVPFDLAGHGLAFLQFLAVHDFFVTELARAAPVRAGLGVERKLDYYIGAGRLIVKHIEVVIEHVRLERFLARVPEP